MLLVFFFCWVNTSRVTVYTKTFAVARYVYNNYYYYRIQIICCVTTSASRCHRCHLEPLSAQKIPSHFHFRHNIMFLEIHRCAVDTGAYVVSLVFINNTYFSFGGIYYIYLLATNGLISCESMCVPVSLVCILYTHMHWQ